jgi:hypothetical protein
LFALEILSKTYDEFEWQICAVAVALVGWKRRKLLIRILPSLLRKGAKTSKSY